MPAVHAVPRMDRESLEAWLWLLGLRGTGPGGRLALLRAFGLPESVRAAAPAAWAACLGRRPAAPTPEEVTVRAEAAVAWCEAGPGRALIGLGDPAYPSALLALPDPPLLLHAEGRLERLGMPAVAVVGSRQASPQGRLDAEAFARELAARGWMVVSGLARGIDAAAHEGALQAAGGAGTLAVLGTGLDRPYPQAHAGLARRIAAEGLLLSEYLLGTPPLAANFPRRNRLIAALARGTLVVEAALASGSLITARLAAELGREVFALPGSIHHPLARGGHRLIKDGAMLVESVDDLLGALAWGGEAVPPRPAARSGAQGDAGPPQVSWTPAGGGLGAARPWGHSKAAPSMDSLPPDASADDPAGDAGGPVADARAVSAPVPTDPEDPLLAALSAAPLDLDGLVARLGEPASRLQARLLALELRGELARLPGGRYQRLHRG